MRRRQFFIAFYYPAENQKTENLLYSQSCSSVGASLEVFSLNASYFESKQKIISFRSTTSGEKMSHAWLFREKTRQRRRKHRLTPDLSTAPAQSEPAHLRRRKSLSPHPPYADAKCVLLIFLSRWRVSLDEIDSDRRGNIMAIIDMESVAAHGGCARV